MSINKACLTLLSLLISFTIAGYGSEIGLLIEPMAKHFDVRVTDAASQFSFFMGGILVGNLLAFAIYRRFQFKTVLIICFIVAFLATFGMHVASVFSLNPVFLSTLGIAYGVGTCGASTIITKIWSERQRPSIFVMQDAVFNAGGMIFPPVTAYLLVRNFDWSIGYLTVSVVGLIILLLAIVAKFDFESDEQHQVSKSQWHIGLTVAGIALFLALIAKITPIIWLPVFLQETYSVTADVAAKVIPKIYIAALTGSLVSVALVAIVGIERFIATVVAIGCVATALFTRTMSLDSITMVAYFFGFAIAALYHSFIVWGLSYIKDPNYRHVSFMYLCGGLGGTVAPYASSKLVDYSNIASVFIACSILYALILLLIAGLHIYTSQLRNSKSFVSE